MRFIKIKLKDASFWGLPDLDIFVYGDMMSDIIDLQSISNENYDIIKESYRTKQICIFDLNESKISMPTIEQVNMDEYCVSDCDEDIDSSIDIVSVTVADDNKKETLELSVKDYEKAELVLTKNGNTIKKIIKNLKSTQDSLCLLMAMKEIETQNKQRKGILNQIDIIIGEINE